MSTVVWELRGRARTTPALGLVLGALLLMLVLEVVPGASRSAGGAPTPAVERMPVDEYGELPLSFVPNAGRLPRDVRYAAHAGGASFYFTQKEAVLAFANGDRGLALRLGFVGANPTPTVEGRRPAAGTVNYLIGADQSEWRSGVPMFGEVVYRDLWPGIDMVFRGAKGRLKYEFLVQPGADARDIQLAYRGADGLAVSAAGELLIQTPWGALRDESPRSFQAIDGQRVPVASAFALGARAGTYGFAVGAHDAQHPLVIDPGIEYSTYLGGSGDDSGSDVAVGSDESVYVTGVTSSDGFPTTSGAFDPTAGGNDDVFVTRLSADGSSLVYATYLGGGSYEIGFGIAVDGSGSAYVSGMTSSTDFPTTPGALDGTLGSPLLRDAFVARLAPDGSSLLYSTYVGGADDDFGYGIAVDAAGSAFVTGTTRSSDFPTTAGAFAETISGQHDGFVLKLDASGSTLDYSTYLGGTGACESDEGFAIAVDRSGSAYVTGGTSSSSFPTTPGAFDTSLGGRCRADAFVTKLDPSGSALVYSTHLGGQGETFDYAYGIAVDGEGNAHVVGSTHSADFPTTAGAFDESRDGADGFVTKLNRAGSGLLYSTYLGGSDSEIVLAVALDGAGDAFVSGGTRSADFPSRPGALDDSYNGGDDAFLARLSSTGAELSYSSFFGGAGDDFAGFGIALDAGGRAVFPGQTNSTDFPTSPGAFDTSANGGYDAFVAKVATADAPPASLVLSPSAGSNPIGTAHTVTAAVADDVGEPLENVVVRFAVTGSTSTSGHCTTATNGECTFAYAGPALPGADSIAAYADSDGDDDAGEPAATASKSWVLPASTAGCGIRISHISRITAANGDRTTFEGNAEVSESGALSGQHSYRDNGPAQRVIVLSINVLAVVCSADGTHAAVYGKARINRSGSYDYRLEVEDNGRRGRGSDKYGILLASGYDSGLQTLKAGNVAINKP